MIFIWFCFDFDLVLIKDFFLKYSEEIFVSVYFKFSKQFARFSLLLTIFLPPILLPT